MPDQTLVCTECGVTFAFSESEQNFFAQRRLNPPKRCKSCRRARRHTEAGRQSGVPPALPEELASAPPSSIPPRDSRTRYRIKCFECGAVALVPFRPIEGRAVYCPTCYRARQGSARQAADGAAIDPSDEGIIE